MLMMYYPFRSEEDLGCNNSYALKLSLKDVIRVVNINHSKAEPYAALVDDAFERIAEQNETNIDPFGQQENDEVYEQLDEHCDSEDEYINTGQEISSI